MGENGIIKLLTQVLPTTSSELQEEVIRSLCNVTVDKLNATEFARLGGPTILLQLVNLPGRPDIFRAICLGTILNVLSNGVQVDLPREEVSVLLKTAGDSFRVQLTAIIIGCFLTPESPLLHSMVRTDVDQYIGQRHSNSANRISTDSSVLPNLPRILWVFVLSTSLSVFAQ